jgi:hypothetical protein
MGEVRPISEDKKNFSKVEGSNKERKSLFLGFFGDERAIGEEVQ